MSSTQISSKQIQNFSYANEHRKSRIVLYNAVTKKTDPENRVMLKNIEIVRCNYCSKMKRTTLVYLIFLGSFGAVRTSDQDQQLPSDRMTGSITKVIIDSDGGVDDVTAIMMMLSDKHRTLDVLAVTTTGGDTDIVNATRNVMKALEIMGSLNKISVYMGNGKRLSTDNNTVLNQYYYGRDGLGDVGIQRPPISNVADGVAPQKIVELVKKYPKQIDLICIAPLTNIAVALQLYPALLDEINTFQIFATTTRVQADCDKGKEFNVVYDAVAAQFVFNHFRSGYDKAFVMSYDTALDSPIDMDWRRTILGDLQSLQVALLNKAEKIWSSKKKIWINCDSILASAYLFRDSVIKSLQPASVSILTHPEESIGISRIYKNETGVILYEQLNTKNYKRILFNCLK